MGFFTARNRQPNPFAERKRREREQQEAELAAAPESSPEPPAPKPQQMQAVPVDLNPDSAEYTQAPDISTYATGGFVGQAVIGPPSPYPYEPVSDEAHVKPEPEFISIPAISPETQAKIDAVVNHAIPPVAEEPKTFADLVETAERGEKRDFDTDALEDVTATDEVPESKRGRGRPRPQETIERDNAVHELLKVADADEGVSKEALAIKLGEKEQQVYSSLRQLTKEGRAETRYVKQHGYRWFAV